MGTQKRDSGIRIKKSDFLCSLGIASNFTWCILEAHSASFASSINQFSVFLNPRIFWLVGVIVMSLCFLIIPQIVKKNDHLFRLVIPLLSTIGTACFAISYSQSMVDPFSLAMLGLALSGVGFAWFVTRFMLLIARVKTYSNAVWVLVGAILIKTTVLIFISMLLPPDIITHITVILPLANAFIFEFARAAVGKEISKASPEVFLEKENLKKHTVFGLPTLPRKVELTKGGQKSLIALMVMAAFMFAIVRRMSFLGLWIDIDSAATSMMWRLPELLSILVFLIPFAYFALIATQKFSLAFRFQPAIVVVMAILFFMSIDSQGDPFFREIQSITINVGESLAYVMGWSIVILALDALDMPPFRVFGIGGLVFSLSSLFWVGLFGESITLNGVIILAVAYVLLIAMLAFSFWESKRYQMLEEAASVINNQIHMREFEGSTPSNEKNENSLVSSITKRCVALSKEYKLSPRETEIFCLLAQGRTRSFIQEDLTLSDSTVKTHITHIYAKLEVSDRQGMMDLVLMDSVDLGDLKLEPVG